MWQGPGHSGCHAEWRPCTLSGQTGGSGGAGQGCEIPVETRLPVKGSVCRCGEGGNGKSERRGREGGNGKSERRGREGGNGKKRGGKGMNCEQLHKQLAHHKFQALQ